MIPQSILITRHDKIGDFVLALPLCKAIKTTYPKIRLGVLVSKVNLEFAKSLDFIDDVMLYSSSFWETVRNVRSQGYQASISCFIDSRLGAMLWLAGIPKRVAPATKLAQIFFNQTVIQHRSRVEKTEWRYNMDLGRALLPHIPCETAPPLISFTDTKIRNRVVLHPGFGGSSDGNLKLEDYLRLGEWLHATQEVEVIFTFGPDDQPARSVIENRLRFPAQVLTSSMSLIGFCRYIAESRLFISTSTGPMHLAGAVNTPTLSFFGNSLFASSKRWATISEPSRQRHFMLDEHYPNTALDGIQFAAGELLEITAQEVFSGAES